MDSIRIKRGMSTELPKSLPLGELAFCIDTRELWVGSGDGLALKRVTNTEITQHLDEWNALYTEVDERFETKYIEVSTQFATKFDEICKQFSVKSDSLDRQFADKFEEICVQFSDKYAGLEAEYAKKLHNIDVLSSDNKESIDLLKRDIGTTENIEDLRQINNLATDTLNDLQAIREDLESDISEIGDFKEDVRKAHIDYSGTHHEKLKDSMDANVDFIMGEFNSVTHTGEYITAQDTILRHIKRAEMRGHTEVNCIKEPSGKEVVLPYEFDETQKDFTLEDTKDTGSLNIVLKGNTEVNVLKNPMRDYVVPYEFEEGYTATLTDTKETGSIQSAILKGQTLVNLSKLNGYQTTTFLPTQTYVPMFQKNVEMYKPNTDYLVIVEFEHDFKYRFGVNISHSTSIFADNVIIENSNGSRIYKNILTTKSDFTGCNVALRTVVYNNSEEADFNQTYRIMIIEYQDGMENWDIPYFEGMQSVQTPVLTTTGKNLFDGNLEYGSFNWSTGLKIESSSIIRSVNPIKINSSNICFTSATGDIKDAQYVFQYDKSMNFISFVTNVNGKISLDTNTKYIHIRTQTNGGNGYVLRELDDYQFQIEEGTQPSSYEPYKSNILSTPSDLELRGIGDVKDTLDLLTGELTQRIGEVDLTEGWQSINYQDDDFISLHKSDKIITNKKNVVCDKLPIEKWSDLGTGKKECVWINGATSWGVILSKTKATNKEEIIEWISQNLKINYKLATESVKTVDFTILDQDGLSVPALSTYNEVTYINTTVPENSLKPLISSKTPEFPVMIKPNTKYSIVADTTTNGFDEIPLTYNLGGAEVETSVGEKLTVIQTPSTLENETFKVTGTGMKLSNVMILEKDLTGKEIPNYTEGMQSVQMPVLSTTGKNLFDGNLINGYYEDGTLNKIIGNTKLYKTIKLNLKKGTYTFSFEESVKLIRQLKDGVYNTFGGDFTKFTTTLNTDGIYVLSFRKTDNTDFDLTKIQIEEGSTATAYEPYQSNILSCNEEVTLRGIGDVQDTLDLMTGEVTERIGEVVLDGSESWCMNMPTTEYSKPTIRVSCANLIKGGYASNNKLISDKIPISAGSYDYEIFGISALHKESLYIQIPRTMIGLDLEENDPTVVAQKFKKWFTTFGTVKVQYPLATESVKTVDFTITNQNGAKVTKLSTFNDVTYISTTVADGALNPIISHKDLEYEVLLKPNTKYSIITNPISNGHINSPISFDLGGQQVETTVGSYCTLVTTPNSLTHNKLVMKGRGNKLSGGVMVIEGDKTGMMFNHFDGMKSVENPTVRVNNANLVDKEDYRGQEQLIIDRGSAYKKFKWLQLKPNTRYTFTMYDTIIPARHWNVLNIELENGNEDVVFVTVYNLSNWNSNSSTSLGTCQTTFITSATGRVRFSNYAQGGVGLEHNGTDNYDCLFGNLCSSMSLQTSDGVQSHVPQESNSLPLTIHMRSLSNGTCDTLNLLTGEYVQNVGEIVIDGTENWNKHTFTVQQGDIVRWQIRIPNSMPNAHSWCDKMISYPNGDRYNTDYVRCSTDILWIYQADTTLTREQFIGKLQSISPITIQYELAEPIVTKLDLQWEDGKLFAYDGITHFFVDVDGGHLQPVLDIDVPTDIVAELSRLRAERTELETSKASLESQITLLDKHNKELVSQVKQLSETNTQLANETKSLRNQTRVNKNNLNYTKSYLLEGQKVLEFNQEELQQEQERTKTEQQVQDQQILSSMLASTEIFELVLALMPMQLGNERQSTEGGSKMVEVYVTLIIAGEKTLEQVPAIVRPKVEAQLKAMGVLA